jgi:hypothetical protein
MAGLVGQVQHWTACASRSVGLRHCHKVNYVFSMCSFFTILCSPVIPHRVIPSCHCIIEVFLLPLQHRKESIMLEDEPSSHGVRFATLTWARAGSQQEGLAANAKWASMKDMLEKFHMSTVYL